MGLADRLRRKAMGALLVAVVRKIAEGDFGAAPKAVYWWLAGIKTWTGLVLIVAWFGLSKAAEAGLCSPCADWAGYVLALGQFLVVVGLVDAGFRARPPLQ